MSWSRRALLRSGLALAAGASLAACGFKPLYGQGSTTAKSGATVDSHLAGIKIRAPVWERSPSPFDSGSAAKHDARTSQLLHNALRDGLNPYGQPANPAYSLGIELSENTAPTISSESSYVYRYNLTLNAHFSLSDSAGEELMLEDVHVVQAYTYLRDPYIDIVALNDARERAAKQLAEMMKFRISAYFAEHG